MKKYTIELSKEQMVLIANCLEDVSRFASGQYELRYTTEEMVRGLDFKESHKRLKEAHSLLDNVKKVLLPELLENQSKGYNGSDFIGNTYQIYRTILYRLAMDENWNNVYSSPALKSGTMGTIKVEVKK